MTMKTVDAVIGRAIIVAMWAWLALFSCLVSSLFFSTRWVPGAADPAGSRAAHLLG
jgi:hypothetical protein